MSQVGDIAAGLKANLDSIDGINVSKFPRSNPVPPILHMWPTSVTYHRAMQKGLSEVVFNVQLVWPFNDDTSAAPVYSFLDASGDRSVRAALESDKTLGGVVDRLQCESCSGLEVSVTVDNQPRFTSDWVVRIYLDGST